jgi:hypothetical protein
LDSSIVAPTGVPQRPRCAGVPSNPQVSALTGRQAPLEVERPLEPNTVVDSVVGGELPVGQSSMGRTAEQPTGSGEIGDKTLEGQDEELTYFSESVPLDRSRPAVRIVGKLSTGQTATHHGGSARDLLKAWLAGRDAKHPQQGASERPAGSGELGDKTLEGQDEELTYFSDKVPLPQNCNPGEMIYSVITIGMPGRSWQTKTTYIRCLPRVRQAVARPQVVQRSRGVRPCPRARRHTSSRSCSRAATADGDGGSDGDGGQSHEVTLPSRRSLFQIAPWPTGARRVLQDRARSGALHHLAPSKVCAAVTLLKTVAEPVIGRACQEGAW